MMFFSKRQQLAIFFVLIFQMVMGQQSYSGAILCLGEDGHIALEISSNGSCASAVASASGTDPHNKKKTHTSHEHSDCNNCLDIVIFQPVIPLSSNDVLTQIDLRVALDPLGSQSNLVRSLMRELRPYPLLDKPLFNTLESRRTVVIIS